MKTSLKNRVALITGASKGIGKVIALSLAKEGVKLALCSSSSNSLKNIETDLKEFGIEYFLCPADLRCPESTVSIIHQAFNHFGELDILINNAGIAIPNTISDTTLEEWDKHMETNVRAPFLLCKESIQYLKKSNSASIINIASVVAAKGYVNQGAYTASKHALMGFTKVLAKEVQKDGIRVHVICPGGVATEMVTQTRPDLDPSGLISTQEIADIVLFLLTHRGNAVIDEVMIRRDGNVPFG